MAVGSLFEAVIQISISILIGLIVIIFDNRYDFIDSSLQITAACVMVCGIICIIPRYFNYFISRLSLLFFKRTLDRSHYVKPKMIAVGTIMYAIATILNGVLIFLVAKSVFPSIAFSDVFYFIGFNSIAGALGMIIFFALSGIGFKESIQIVSLSIILPTEYALIITVITRLIEILMDFVFLGITMLIYKHSNTIQR